MLKRTKKQKGQTLIEVVVAMGLGVIIIVALVALTSRANRSANAAKIAEIASKFAQEGQEAIRQIKVNDGEIRNGPAGVTNWSGLYVSPPAGTFTTASPLNMDLVKPGGTHGGTLVTPCGATVWCLDASSANLGTPEDGSTRAPGTAGITVTRTVQVFDASGAPGVSACEITSVASLTLNETLVKSVQVVVKWADQTGNHQIVLQSCITSKT